MKANEAPENMYIPQKIYLPYKDGKVIGLVKETGVPFKSGVDGNIEYTRTDAFIEKACDFFEENIEEEDCKFGSSEWTELRAEYKSLDSFIRAFVNHMKGE